MGVRDSAARRAARVAPAVPRIGLVPTVTATHTEPFHASKAIATLDYVSGGRAGVLPATTGAAARMIFEQGGYDPVLARSRTYPTIFRRLLKAA